MYSRDGVFLSFGARKNFCAKKREPGGERERNFKRKRRADKAERSERADLILFVRTTINMAAMMFNQRTSGFVGTPTVSKSAPRTTMRTTFTIESGLSTADRNQKRSRIGKQPIAVPKGVTYDLKEGSLKVKVRFLNSFKARFGEINLRIRAERRLFRASKTSNFARGFPLSQRRRGGISNSLPLSRVLSSFLLVRSTIKRAKQMIRNSR